MNKRFVVVIPSYKNAAYYSKNLISALSQNYDNYRIVYVDDCSPDNTGGLVEEFLKKHDHRNLVELHKNTERIGALANLHKSIHAAQDDEIIITLDGDDWFAHTNVLNTLNAVYQGDVLMTYGQYRSFPDNRIGCSREIPQIVKDQSSYRQYGWCSSHLRSFYAHLFKKIKEEDLKDSSGKFYPMTWDLAMMFPMLEMAGSRQKFVSEVLYIYNYETPINDAKVNLNLQQSLERLIRAKSKYSRIP